jgi:hypothetical protein
MRREGSVAKLRPAHDPVSRYVEDAMALALFHDPARGGDVMNRIDKDVSRAAGDTLKACNEGGHGGHTGVLVDFVRDAERLAQWKRTRP